MLKNIWYLIEVTSLLRPEKFTNNPNRKRKVLLYFSFKISVVDIFCLIFNIWRVLFTFVQHYMQIYEDVYKLRDLYYMKYMHALRKHVEKQRDGIQRKSEKLKQHLEKKQAQEVCSRCIQWCGLFARSQKE